MGCVMGSGHSLSASRWQALGWHAKHSMGICSCDVYAICRGDRNRLRYCGIWDPLTGAELWSKPCVGVVGCAYSVSANKMADIFFMTNDARESREVRVVAWDLFSGHETLSVTGAVTYDWFCEFNQDGTRLMSWNTYPEGLCVRDVASGDILFTLLQQGSWPFFMGDAMGNSIAVRRGASIHEWNIDSGNEVSSFNTNIDEFSILAAVPSSDGRLCAVYSDSRVEIWEVSTGMVRFEQLRGGIATVCIGGDGDLVIVSWMVKRESRWQSKLTCWRISESSVVFEVNAAFGTYGMCVYSPLRSSFLICYRYQSRVFEINVPSGVMVARARIYNLIKMHGTAAMTILL
jgi:hypothetical protein